MPSDPVKVEQSPREELLAHTFVTFNDGRRDWTRRCSVCDGRLNDPQHGVSQAERDATLLRVLESDL
jgi:hypothetical protein